LSQLCSNNKRSRLLLPCNAQDLDWGGGGGGKRNSSVCDRGEQRIKSRNLRPAEGSVQKKGEKGKGKIYPLLLKQVQNLSRNETAKRQKRGGEKGKKSGLPEGNWKFSWRRGKLFSNCLYCLFSPRVYLKRGLN